MSREDGYGCRLLWTWRWKRVGGRWRSSGREEVESSMAMEVVMKDRRWGNMSIYSFIPAWRSHSSTELLL